MENLRAYYGMRSFDDTFEIDPQFFIDIFPKLLEFRRESYKEFVQKTNGKIIDVSLLHNIHSAKEFLDIVHSK